MALSGKKRFQYKCKIEDTSIFAKDKVALLGITVDNELTFESHIEKAFIQLSYKNFVKNDHTNYGPYKE